MTNCPLKTAITTVAVTAQGPLNANANSAASTVTATVGPGWHDRARPRAVESMPQSLKTWVRSIPAVPIVIMAEVAEKEQAEGEQPPFTGSPRAQPIRETRRLPECQPLLRSPGSCRNFDTRRRS